MKKPSFQIMEKPEGFFHVNSVFLLLVPGYDQDPEILREKLGDQIYEQLQESFDQIQRHLGSIAILPSINHEGKRATWFNTAHRSSIQFDKYTIDGDEILFELQDGEILLLKQLTRELWEKYLTATTNTKLFPEDVLSTDEKLRDFYIGNAISP